MWIRVNIERGGFKIVDFQMVIDHGTNDCALLNQIRDSNIFPITPE